LTPIAAAMQGKPGLSCVPESEHRGWTSWLDHGDQKMAVNKSDIAKVQAAVAQSLREHSGLFLTEGIILLVLGIAAIILPQPWLSRSSSAGSCLRAVSSV
jgi:hypothetical protein